MKYLIIGLGNIGAEYRNTRHNIGFMVLDALANKKEVAFSSDRLAFTTMFKYKGRSIYMVKPTTYMNLSGKAVNYWMKQLKIPKENTLTIVDDLALPYGTLRMRGKGSAAGHNGLKDIEQVLGGTNYPRLRFGIGDDYSKGKQIDYVLGAFSADNQIDLSIHIDKACEMILSFATIGINRTMTSFNK